MHVELGEAGHALRTLEEKKLVREVRGARVALRTHRRRGTEPAARSRAVIALLLLRGPQTQNELLTRSDRLADFPDIESLNDTLQRLIARDPPLAVRIGRAAGQREDRYMHLLCGPVSAELLLSQRRTKAKATIRRVPIWKHASKSWSGWSAELQRRIGGE